MKNDKEYIIKLRSEGKTYAQITELTGTSKSMISYYVSEFTKIKSYSKTLIRRSSLSALSKKIEHFRCVADKSTYVMNTNYERRAPEFWIRRNLSFKIGKFQVTKELLNQGVNKMPKINHTFTSEDLQAKSGSTCYLTGRQLDLTDGHSYELDHIIPKYLGGSNDLDNCGIACKNANRAKAHMSTEEFFQLCVEVVKYNNLTIH
jgi:hypothetical protein